MGLGSLADKPLSEARDEAAMLRVLVKRGGDPWQPLAPSCSWGENVGKTSASRRYME